MAAEDVVHSLVDSWFNEVVFFADFEEFLECCCWII